MNETNIFPFIMVHAIIANAVDTLQFRILKPELLRQNAKEYASIEIFSKNAPAKGFRGSLSKEKCCVPQASVGNWKVFGFLSFVWL